MRIFKNSFLVLRLWKWNNFQVELCIFKPYQTIDWHKHDLVDVEVMHIFGRAMYYIRNPDFTNLFYKYAYFKNAFKCYTVKYSYWHKAEIGRFGLVTLSIQRWNTPKPMLITEDYTEQKF